MCQSIRLQKTNRFKIILSHYIKQRGISITYSVNSWFHLALPISFLDKWDQPILVFNPWKSLHFSIFHGIQSSYMYWKFNMFLNVLSMVIIKLTLILFFEWNKKELTGSVEGPTGLILGWKMRGNWWGKHGTFLHI